MSLLIFNYKLNIFIVAACSIDWIGKIDYFSVKGNQLSLSFKKSRQSIP